MIDHASGSPPTLRWIRRLSGILLVAAALRLWGVDFALDVERARPDEEFVVGKAVEMLRSGDLDPHFFHYPSLVMYADAALLGIVEPVVSKSFDPRLLGRLLSVVLGVGTVAVVGALGARLFSPRAGLAAAAFLAVAYQHVRESHFATTDVAFVFFVSLSIWFLVDGRGKESRIWLRLAAVSAGLAMSAKYPGVLALVPLTVVVATLEGASWRERAWELAFALCLALGVFAVTSPYFFLDPEGARTSLAQLFRETWGGGALTAWNPWYPITFSLGYGIGIPLLGLGAMGLAANAARHDPHRLEPSVSRRRDDDPDRFRALCTSRRAAARRRRRRLSRSATRPPVAVARAPRRGSSSEPVVIGRVRPPAFSKRHP